MTAGVLSVLIMMYSLLAMYNSYARAARYDDVKSNTSMLANVINTSGYLYSQEGNTADDDINALADIYSGRILVIDKNLKIVKDTYNKENGKICISTDVIRCIRENAEIKVENKASGYVELIMPIVDTDGKISGVVAVGYSQDDIRDILANLNKKSVILAVILTILIGMLALFVSSKVSKSVRKVADSLNMVSEGYLNGEIKADGFKELQALAQSLNTMFAKLSRLENTRQEFVSNVSHELKTPITSMKVLADSLIAQENVPNEIYQEFMTDIAAEIERENKIITDLLSLVKMDKSASELNIEAVDINELLEMLLKRLRPLASERNIDIVFESFRPVTAEVDETKISLALSNLIENAIKYNYEDGWIRVSLNADYKYFYVRVSDSGVGIPEDCIDNIFERFYRVDKARSRDTGGTGLGLSITRNVIVMHKGAIKVHSKEKEGTTFTVRIPLNYVV